VSVVTAKDPILHPDRKRPHVPWPSMSKLLLFSPNVHHSWVCICFSRNTASSNAPPFEDTVLPFREPLNRYFGGGPGETLINLVFCDWNIKSLATNYATYRRLTTTPAASQRISSFALPHTRHPTTPNSKYHARVAFLYTSPRYIWKYGTIKMVFINELLDVNHKLNEISAVWYQITRWPNLSCQ
jgi:hypothetical protein